MFAQDAQNIHAPSAVVDLHVRLRAPPCDPKASEKLYDNARRPLRGFRGAPRADGRDVPAALSRGAFTGPGQSPLSTPAMPFERTWALTLRFMK